MLAYVLTKKGGNNTWIKDILTNNKQVKRQLEKKMERRNSVHAVLQGGD